MELHSMVPEWTKHKQSEATHCPLSVRIWVWFNV